MTTGRELSAALIAAYDLLMADPESAERQAAVAAAREHMRRLCGDRTTVSIDAACRAVAEVRDETRRVRNAAFTGPYS